MVRRALPRQFRFGDLAPGAKLLGSCDRCQHIRVLDRIGLQQKLGVSFMLAYVARRLRCGRCRSTEVRLLMVTGDSARWYTRDEAPIGVASRRVV